MAHRYLPLPDFHRLDWQPYGLRAKAQRGKDATEAGRDAFHSVPILFSPVSPPQERKFGTRWNASLPDLLVAQAQASRRTYPVKAPRIISRLRIGELELPRRNFRGRAK